MRKRLSRRLRRLGLQDLGEYTVYLGTHLDEWAELDCLCRITISRFWRDRAVFEAVGARILPNLERAVQERGGRVIRAWSAGCASGEDPYSLSLAWALDARRHPPGVELEIVATEADPGMLERSRIACYPPASLRALPHGWVAEAFDLADETMCLRAAFRNRVELLQQDVSHEMPSGLFDLVLCRNLVFTYFDVSLQCALLERMLRRLAPDGLLVLGGHETLPAGDWPLERPYGALPIHRLSEPVEVRHR